MASDASIAGNRTLTRVVFRADASETIGTGHVIRCLTLATALRERGVASVFVSREHAGNLCALIEAQGFPVTRLSKGTDSAARPFDVPPHAAWLGVSWQTDAEQTRVAIESMGKTPDWLIVDHYALDANWESAMRPFARRCFAIDDLADRQHDCDLLLDQNLTANLRVRYTGKVPAQCVQLIGPEFALLQPVYAELHGSLAHRAGPVKRLFVYFGGADPHGLSARALEACKSAQLGDVEIDVVVGRAVYDDLRLQSSSDGRIRVHTSLPSLAPLMSKADLAIGAAGVATWERFCLGLPALVVTVADNQIPVTQNLHELELIRWIGRQDIALEKLREEIVRAVRMSSEELSDWSQRCRQVCDGGGVSRVLEALTANNSAGSRAS